MDVVPLAITDTPPAAETDCRHTLPLPSVFFSGALKLHEEGTILDRKCEECRVLLCVEYGCVTPARAQV